MMGHWGPLETLHKNTVSPAWAILRRFPSLPFAPSSLISSSLHNLLAHRPPRALNSESRNELLTSRNVWFLHVVCSLVRAPYIAKGLGGSCGRVAFGGGRGKGHKFLRVKRLGEKGIPRILGIPRWIRPVVWGRRDLDERGIIVKFRGRKCNLTKGDPQTSDQILCSPGDPLIECNHKCNCLTLTTKWVVFPTARRSKLTLCESYRKNNAKAVVKARCSPPT